jgi:hypothetical protein
MKNGTNNRLRGSFGYSRIALVLFSMLGLLTTELPLYAADGSETWVRSIHDANLDSLVFITVKIRYENGLEDTFTGTGFIVHPEGYVLTCNHVIPTGKADYTKIESTGSVGGRYELAYPLTIVHRDEQADLLLLKLPQKKDSWGSVKSIAQAQRDSEIVALGFPLDKDVVEEPGLINGADNDGRWLTNAGLMPGMSGGPAFDRSGALIGIVADGYDEAKSRDLLIPISFSTSLLQSINSPLLINPQESTSAASSRRCVVEIFPYAVDGPGDSLFPFNHLQPIIANLTESLAARSDRPENLPSLRAIAKESEFPDVATLRKAWRDGHDILEILGGTVYGKSIPTVVASIIYLGELQGSLRSTTTEVKAELRPEDYGVLDTFSALTLYALAMEAKLRGADKTEIQFYLAEARGALRETQRSTTKTSEERLLTDAVDAEWQKCKQP